MYISHVERYTPHRDDQSREITMSGWEPSGNSGSGGGGGGWGGGREKHYNSRYGPGGGGGWGRGGPESSDNNNNNNGGGWGREERGANGSQGGSGGGWGRSGDNCIDRERETTSTSRQTSGSSGNRQYQYHGGGGRGAHHQRRQDNNRRGGVQMHHPYANAQPPRGRWTAPTRAPPENENDGQSALKRPKVEELEEDIDGKMHMEDGDDVTPLEEKVTFETWNDCSWDEKIASQHPDWIDRPPFTVSGKRYLQPGKSIEQVLPSCPFDALKDECRTDEWMKRKRKAAEVAFDKGWKAIEDDNFANCQLNESEVKKFFDALPYNLVSFVSFDVLGIYAKDETHCYCPCSSKCVMWRKQFDLDGVLDNCQIDDCGNTFKSSEPHGLMQHLETKSRNKKGLHFFVQLYVVELYGPPYCGSVGHKGLYPKSSKSHRQAEAYEKKIMVRAYKKLEDELKQERRENEKLEQEVKQHEEDFKQLEKVSEDLAERLKNQEKNAKLLNVDVEQMKELEKDMDSKRIDQFYQSYRGIMRGFVNMIDMGNKGSGGSVEIKVSDKFKIEALFEELYEGKKKSFLFKSVDSKNENVAGKILRDWKVVFDASEISKLKSVKQETEAVDEGGPSKEFMNLVWKRLHKLEVTAKGNDGNQKSVKLMDRSDTGYLMPQTDDKIQVFFDSVPASNHEAIRKKIEAYYQAIGKLFLHALASHWHTDDSESGSSLMIPSTTLPPFYRQYLLRGCKPDDEDYPNHEVVRDINAIGFSWGVDQVIGKPSHLFFDDDDLEPFTEETFFSKFLPKIYLDERCTALENIREGLTLEGYLPIPTILKTLPSKALEKIAFVDEGYDSAEDVIAFLEPVYCKEVLLPDETGKICSQEVEGQVLESQILFFEQTLPTVLRDLHNAEKADKEKYVKKLVRRKDFLSVCQALAGPF